jgi:clan AA aspartic protease
MITGTVNPDREAVIQLRVRGPTGRVRTVAAVIDTGFSDELTLPPTLIAELRLTWQERGNALLADGSITHFDIYAARLAWDRHSRTVAVFAAETTPLVGMALLDGHELNAKARVGGKVTIRALARRGG